MICATTAADISAQTFATVANFNGANGLNPSGTLIQGPDGNLYGTTPYATGPQGYGTIFKMTPRGTLTSIYHFMGTHGSYPQAGVVLGTDGNFYGTTSEGTASGSSGDGTVFEITPRGVLTTLYSFGGPDGATPFSALTQATDRNFYGTTEFGGANDVCTLDIPGCGTIYKISPTGTLTTLYSFCSQSGCTDGNYPFAGPIQATDGNFYGTTVYGGASDQGTVFRITPTGVLKTLHSFNGTDGAYPYAGLVQGSDGAFYGTTSEPGTGDGTIFRITTSGLFGTLHRFTGSDGSLPSFKLIQGTDGNLHGTTNGGGANGEGTIFKITLRGELTTLYSFCSESECTDGNLPDAPLIQDTDGSFYGTTASGGADASGTVFKLSVGLAPFVRTQPTSGKVGAVIRILGTDLTGATNVTFNGTAATFTIVSTSLITATVPGGATSGKVRVATPGGPLSSNLPFRVVP